MIDNKKYGFDAEFTERVDGVAGRTVQDIYVNKYDGVVIQFTDGSTLHMRQRGQTGWIDVEPLAEAG